ncbi:hypothetical protein XNC2_0107 [Xenorhabdus nematophila AN6/1]|nr:hypothetical protein XNC2_0107 [Xenorhabdus nematophila AN6/1]
MKQSEFRRWLEAQGVEVSNGTNHLKLKYKGETKHYAETPQPRDKRTTEESNS